MATTIATQAMSPRAAVALAAVLNLIGAFLSVAVAATIASGIVDQTKITVPVIFAGLVDAIIWNVITWYMGIPSYEVTTVQMIALTRPAKMTGTVILVWSTMPLAMVAATATERKAPIKFRTAASPTAARGDMAWVAMVVAIALAVS